MIKVRNLILSPWVISLFPFLLLLLFIHNDFKKFILETENSVVFEPGEFILYDDLDNDGISEQLIVKAENDFTALGVYGENGIIDQWNFEGNLDFQRFYCIIITGDRDNDNTKEIYLFTLSSDSIFLNSIDNMQDLRPSISRRLIAVAGKSNHDPDPFIIPAEMEDLDGDGKKELIFGIGTGFSVYPRNVYAYYVEKDSLCISPESSYFIWKIMQTDITGDGIKEIIPYGYATSNVEPAKAQYHDYSAFLMVLGQDLRFKFEPIKMGGRYSKITPVENSALKDSSLTFLYNPGSSDESSTVFRVNSNGRLTDSLKLPFYAIDILKTGPQKDLMYLLLLPQEGLGLISGNFELKKVEGAEGDFQIIEGDYDGDGRNEILKYYSGSGLMTIYREGLKQPMQIRLTVEGTADWLISFKDDAVSGRKFSVQAGRNHYLLKYGRNPYYAMSFLIYFLIYSGLTVFAFVVKKLQENQTKRKFENEKKISELQLALIRNQLDPHFTLNAINSVIYSVEHSARKQAGLHLRRFASLYRNLLLSAGSTRRTISEELEFCRDYMTLEQMRFDGKFNFKITVDDTVDESVLIPKMLIQIYIENAIKHGLASLKSGGLIETCVYTDGRSIVFTVTDNGIGRERSEGMRKSTTGKGLEITDKLYEVYGKFYNESISAEFQDLYGTDGQPAGTKVVIKIIRQNDK